MSTDQVSQHYEELLCLTSFLAYPSPISPPPRLLASSPPRPNMPVQPLPPEILRHTFTFFPHHCAITHLRCHTGDPLYCCSLVSATWRSIAIPLIWRTFNINWDPPLLRKLLRFLTGEQPQTFRFATHVTLDEDQIMSNPSPNLPSPNLPSPNLPSPNLPSPNLPSPNHRALRRAALAIINSRRYLSYVRYLRLAMNAPHDDLTTPATLTVMLLNLLPRNQICALTLYYPTDSRSHDMPVNLCIDALAPLLGRLARISIETADDFPFGLIPSTLPATLHHLDLSAAPGRTSLELLTPTEPHRDDKPTPHARLSHLCPCGMGRVLAWHHVRLLPAALHRCCHQASREGVSEPALARPIDVGDGLAWDDYRRGDPCASRVVPAARVSAVRRSRGDYGRSGCVPGVAGVAFEGVDYVGLSSRYGEKSFGF
ncbi:hypothetical protein BC936DRAFT_149902 [Jimgerdemannia flammicorona]|uniref:F-box domain-containing protein n=1 Tax=Jimgerdemannia flammicorona TaxID=994334 RepID=A0A433CZV5_9FUNG|nr:hypothetical protein BC936DRAFT_149902 [Jimgerdemannia flammicorona]